MLDGQIVAALIAEIKRQLNLYGVSDLRVSRRSQPTRQHSGAAQGAEKYQVFIEPVTNTNIGWGRTYSQQPDESLGLTINHVKQKTYQISALSDFDPANPSDIPAHDLAHIVADTLEHPDSIRALKSAGVNILSCTPVRPAFDLNESDQWESTPSFDVVVSYNTQYTKPAQVVGDTIGAVGRV